MLKPKAWLCPLARRCNHQLREDSIAEARQIVPVTRGLTLAESLGIPRASSIIRCICRTRASPADVRQNTGIRDSRIRLRIGLEDSEDRIADLDEVQTACWAGDPQTMLETAS